MPTAPFSILLVEDSEGDAELTCERLLEGELHLLHVHRCASLAEARAFLASQTADAALLDLNLPDSRGIDTLAAVREVCEGPIIVLTGVVDQTLRRQAIDAGAEDVIAKGEANSPLFARAVLYVVQREQARSQQRRIEGLLDASPDANLIVDATGVVRFLNQTALDLFERTREDFIGELLAFSVKDGATHDIVVRRRSGEMRNCEMRVAAFDWERGPALFASLRDVTAVRENEARFHRLAESGTVGIVIADLLGNVHDANETFLDRLGYSREELARGNVRWAEMIPPDGAPVAAGAIGLLQQTGRAPPFEIDMIHKDGARVPLLIGAAMLESAKVIAFTVDLSQRKRAEAAKEVAEVALRASEEQLRHAQKMEAVGRLAGGVAHDFNNLLSVIMSYGELLHSSLRNDDPMRSDLGEIRKAADRAAGLTRQLLMFSRQQVLQPKVFDLNDTLRNMHKMLERLLGEDVDLALSLAPSATRVKADPGSIEQVVMNLVVNARDAMALGGQLTVETDIVTLDDEYAKSHVGTVPGRHVMLAVTDTGTGMDRATQSRIFEPFFTTKEHGKGTGLGLSTVFGIVRQSGGTVWVYSELGKGTTFKVYLPQVDTKLDAIHSHEPPGLRRGSETVLVVEDEEQVRVVAASILRRYGYRVIEARNAGEALLVCEKHDGTIDLLLTDVVMPQMSGPELARRLLAERPAMKLLCMSGYTDDSVVRHGVLTEEIAFLQKPLTADALTRKVREVLDA